MANELEEFLIAIAKLIKWIFEWTLNLIAICALLLALCAPWRTFWIIQNIKHDFTWPNFRRKAWIQLAFVFIDLAAFNIGLLSLIWISRIADKNTNSAIWILKPAA